MSELFILALLVIFFSTLVRSAFGFGDALLAMPLLALLMPVKTAAPVVAMISITVAVYILIGNFRKVEFKSLWVLIVSSILGIPAGLIYLKDTADELVKIVLGVMLMLFALFKLLKPGLIELKSAKSAPVFGFVSGILGGAYNTNGPPVIIYGTLRAWPPDKFRAILQGFFLPVNIFIIIGHYAAGLWTEKAVYLFLWSFPVMAAAILLGSYINKKIPSEKFTKYIYILLFFIGLYLCVNVIFFYN
ncbi:MAG: sulfite exporter TauE/SafE family protein [Candidatus Kapaibacterium sp.]